MHEKKLQVNALQLALQSVSELTAEDARKIETAILENRLNILHFLQTVQDETTDAKHVV